MEEKDRKDTETTPDVETETKEEAATNAETAETAEEYQEYVIFTVKNKDGQDVELAIVDEFDYAHKHYVVGALCEGDEISQEGLYIYRAKISPDGKDFVAEKITNQIEYQEIAQAYMEME